MTSLQIAEVAGKRHCDVMRSIRMQEKAWEKINGRKFALVDYIDEKGEKRPCYELTKEESLYIATKFNDEARAILVKRWIELEKERIAKHVNLTELLAVTKSVGDELQREAESGKHLPVRNVPLSQHAVILYSYIRRNIPERADSFPFIANREGEMSATGLTRQQLAEAWSELEVTGYIISRKTDCGKVFICNPDIY